MGIRPSFPIQETPITFESHKLYTSCGKKDPSRCTRIDITEFEKVTERHFQRVLGKRKNVEEAKGKLQDITPHLAKFPKWTHHDIFDLRTEFMAFDRNNDGTIDFYEMNTVLDELGDTSSRKEREDYFHKIDIDKSDSIDFEEFLDYIYSRLMKKGSEEDLHRAIGKVCSYGRKFAMLSRVMSVQEQIDAAIF